MPDNTYELLPEDRLLTRADAAPVALGPGGKPRTLEAMAMQGSGPPYVVLAGRALYPERWISIWRASLPVIHRAADRKAG